MGFRSGMFLKRRGKGISALLLVVLFWVVINWKSNEVDTKERNMSIRSIKVVDHSTQLNRNENRKFKKTRRTKKAELLQVDARYMKNGFRCKVLDLGCIKSEKNFPKLIFQNIVVLTRIEMTLEKCFTFCSDGQFKLAALRETKCICTNEFVKGKQINVDKNACQSRCNGDPEDTCGGQSGWQVYKIVEKCTKGTISPELTIEQEYGCFQKPPKFEKLMSRALFAYYLSPIACFIACERSKFHLAIITSPNLCFCANFHNKLDLKALRANYSICNAPCTDEATSLTTGLQCGNDDTHMSVWRTLNAEQCCEKSYLPAGKLPLTAFVSFPGSGNSWMRYLLETVSGIYTGSVYTDNLIATDGFFGEMDNITSHRTLIVKDHVMHKAYTKFPNSYKRVILLVRNPYEAILAEFNRHTSEGHSHTGVAQQKEFNSTDWKKYVDSSIRMWKSIHETVISSKMPILLVQYNNLVENYEYELKTIFQFIDFKPLDYEVRLSCLKRNIEGFYKRKEKITFNPYTKKQEELINKNIGSIRSKLGDSGLGLLPKWEH